MKNSKEKNDFKNISGSLVIVDIGASGGLHPRWKKSNFPFTGILFEPDPREYDNLKASLPDNYKVYNVALAAQEGEVDLHLCRKQMCSSILPPNLPFLRLFPESERFDVLEMAKVQASSLDVVLANESYVDFIKIDAEASELPILKGAEKTLKGVLGLEVESAFCHMREGQPVFHDVSKFLMEHDFTLYDIRSDYWQRKKTFPYSYQKGQIIWGDSLYFKSPEYIMQHFSNDSCLISRAIMLYLAYGYYDLSKTLLTYVEQDSKLNMDIFNALSKQVNKGISKVQIPRFRGRYFLSKLFYTLAWKLRSSYSWSRSGFHLGN